MELKSNQKTKYTRGFWITALVTLFLLIILWSMGDQGGSTSRTSNSTPASPRNAGSLKVDRVWNEYGSAYALVTYTNTTQRTFRGGVSIQATAYDPSGNKLGIGTRSFFCHEIGDIPPGFSRSLEIPVDLHGASFGRMECIISMAK